MRVLKLSRMTAAKLRSQSELFNKRKKVREGEGAIAKLPWRLLPKICG